MVRCGGCCSWGREGVRKEGTTGGEGKGKVEGLWEASERACVRVGERVSELKSWEGCERSDIFYLFLFKSLLWNWGWVPGGWELGARGRRIKGG